jgi:hypothetical protein
LEVGKPGVEEQRRSVGILRDECGGRKNERWECGVEMARCFVLLVPQTQRRHAALFISRE